MRASITVNCSSCGRKLFDISTEVRDGAEKRLWEETARSMYKGKKCPICMKEER